MRFVLPGWLLAVALLSGCVGLQKEPSRIDWEQRREQLLTFESWSLRGRVAIKAASGGGNANLDWLQQGELSRLRLAGPFGAGRVELQVAPEKMTFSDRAGERTLAYAGPDAAERFMTEQLGWSFPVRSARYWVLGLLDPAFAGERLYDEQGALESLRQHGWTVVYDRFADLGGQYIPARLEMENPQLRLRVLISSWSPDSGLTQ